MTCLGCGSKNTQQNGRVLTCRSCEVVYFIPAVELVRASREKPFRSVAASLAAVQETQQ